MGSEAVSNLELGCSAGCIGLDVDGRGAQFDAAAIHGLYTFDYDLDGSAARLATLAARVGFGHSGDFAGGSGAGCDDHLIVDDYVVAYKEVNGVANLYVFAAEINARFERYFQTGRDDDRRLEGRVGKGLADEREQAESDGSEKTIHVFHGCKNF